MKKHFPAVLLLLLFHLPVFSQLKFDVLSYRFEIMLFDSTDLVLGRAFIKLKANENISSATFDLTGMDSVSKKGMSVMGVIGDTLNLPYQHTGDKLTVQLAKPLQAGEEKELLIAYKGIPKDGLIISQNKFERRTFFADNWPNRGHNWLPCVDDPADKAAVDFVITAPEHYQVVANGILVEESSLPKQSKLTHWREEVPIATKVMVIGAADFAMRLAGVVDGCINVQSWVYPENQAAGFYDYSQAIEILPFFIKNVGPYGYKKLANVQSKTTFGGLENANTIFYSENSVTGTRVSESLLAHEIAHQWFGNMATEKTFAHLWLSEGFATYMTILYMENKYGKDTALYMLQQDRRDVIGFAKTNDKPVVDETTNYMELLNPNSYQKGGWILHMLRRQLGDAVFYKSIQSYYATYAGKNADTRDLQQVFEKVSGKKLAVFFDQWLYQPGLPKLELEWKYSAADKKLKLTIMQLQPQGFQFPLEIGIQTGSADYKLTSLSVTQPVQTFTLPAPQKVTGVLLDPQTSLLFDGKVKEGK